MPEEQDSSQQHLELPISNPAEQKIAEAFAGQCGVKDVVTFLQDQWVFGLLDAAFKANPDGTCPPIAPLLMNKPDGVGHLALFTSVDRATRVIKMKPEYQFAFRSTFSWWLGLVQPHWGLVINPTWDLTIEMAPENVQFVKSQLSKPEEHLMRENLGILITGAGNGIGESLAMHFGAESHTVIVTDIDESAARRVAEAVLSAGGNALLRTLDVTSEEAIGQLMANLGDAPAADLGESQVDVLINNAGIQHVAQLEEFPQSKWDQVTNIILKGAVMMTRAVLPGMRARGFGRIVNIGSIHSLVASPCKTAYVAAKHGLHGFSKAVALETADTDITINTICPSYIKTALVEKQIAGQAKAHGISEDEVVKEIMLAPMPKKAFVGIDEVAATVEFFLSDMAKNITGQAIAIDGGWTAR